MRSHQDHNLPGHFELDAHGRPTKWVPALTSQRRDKMLREAANTAAIVVFCLACAAVLVVSQVWGLAR